MVGWVGWIATDLSCKADQAPGGAGCPVPATIISVVCFFGATVGLTVVLALTSRSIAEYRAQRDEDRAGES
jgi:hypothetical protein